MLSHKIRIYPSKRQAQLLGQACGVARFSYNWGLNKWIEMYKNSEKPNLNKVKLAFNKFKKENEEVKWLYDVTKCSPEYSLMDLDRAFKMFFKKVSKFPKFKKKKFAVGTFSVANDKFWIKEKVVMLPKIGKLPCAEKLRFSGKIMKGTVSHQGGKWFLSTTVDANKKKVKNNKAVGIDLGIKNTLILSTGEKFTLPDFRKEHKRIIKKQKNLSRKKKGSSNRKKAIIKLQYAWLKLSNKKKDWIEKATSAISKQYRFIALETLNIRGMMKNRKLSAKFQQAGLSQIVDRLKTKADVLQVGRFFPSTQLCSCCGFQNKSLTLKDRFWICPQCKTKHDRDINSGINILREAIPNFKSVDKKALVLEPCVLKRNYA